MIRPLRQMHRRMFIALGGILPVVFTLGIAARRPVPRMASLPGELSAFSRASWTTVWERSDLFTKVPIQARLFRESGNGGRFALELSAARSFVKPDLIVYWVPARTKVTDTIPDNALLLGAFSPLVALPLPVEAAKTSGMLVLYSLADQEIVEISKPGIPD